MDMAQNHGQNLQVLAVESRPVVAISWVKKSMIFLLFVYICSMFLFELLPEGQKWAQERNS